MAIDRSRGYGSYLPLRDAIDQLFAQSFITPSGMAGGFPQADMYMNDNDVVLEMAVPGAKPDDIHVSVTGDTVIVSGEVRHQHKVGTAPSGQSQQGQNQQGGNQQGQSKSSSQKYMNEIWQGSFQRSFTLPTEVDANKSDATFENGILTITMPKSEASKPRKIQVKQGQGAISGQVSQQGTASGQSNQQSAASSQTGQQGGNNVQKETVPVQSGGSSSSNQSGKSS